VKADLTSEYVCRILNHMDRRGVEIATPRNHDEDLEAEPWLDFSSGYVQRSVHLFPKQGTEKPWKLHQTTPRPRRLRFARSTTACWSSAAARRP
jgi:hypothetical protein